MVPVVSRKPSETEMAIVKAQRNEDSVFAFIPKRIRKAVGGIEPGDRLLLSAERRDGGTISLKKCGEAEKHE